MRKTLMALGVSLLLVTSVFAQGITLNINNEVVETRVAPVIEKGVTLVPLRVVSENLGGLVHWDHKTKTITITDGETPDVTTTGPAITTGSTTGSAIEIKLKIDDKNVTVNGDAKELLLAPKLIDNVTMVPIRFVSENLGAQVDWDKASLTVKITSK